MYSGGGPLSRDVITARVLDTLKGYEKVDPAKVSSLLIAKSVLLTSRRVQLQVTSSFQQDLGLDSLDAVEVMMAVEEVRTTPSCKSQVFNSSDICRSSPSKFPMQRQTRSIRSNKVP
jgi:acyl carrier protein